MAQPNSSHQEEPWSTSESCATRPTGTGQTKKAAGRTDALLAHHDGTFPHDLPLLGYLYLLDLMSQPESLRLVLHWSKKL